MIRLIGNWKKGGALDLHTESSIYLGVDEFGHDHYDTKRTEMGEYVYKLKYKSDLSVIPQIIEIIIKKIKAIDDKDFYRWFKTCKTPKYSDS